MDRLDDGEVGINVQDVVAALGPDLVLALGRGHVRLIGEGGPIDVLHRGLRFCLERIAVRVAVQLEARLLGARGGDLAEVPGHDQVKVEVLICVPHHSDGELAPSATGVVCGQQRVDLGHQLELGPGLLRGDAVAHEDVESEGAATAAEDQSHAHAHDELRADVHVREPLLQPHRNNCMILFENRNQCCGDLTRRIRARDGLVLATPLLLDDGPRVLPMLNVDVTFEGWVLQERVKQGDGGEGHEHEAETDAYVAASVVRRQHLLFVVPLVRANIVESAPGPLRVAALSVAHVDEVHRGLVVPAKDVIQGMDLVL
mmetsp:Transcript_82422/g.209516  ORF Transcript_82422/g.209516 Transcript_82422/m.209516 type:complete len:315 (-) Transcript_82422:168-1112(-)